MNTDELIRGYFNKTLSQDDERIYLDKYETDAEFRVLADQLEIEILGIRAAGRQELKDKFSNWDAQQNSINKTSSSSFTSYIKYGIAASVIVAIGLYFFIPAPDEDLFLAYYEPYQNFEHTAIRNEVADSLSLKNLAYFNYDLKNYKMAEVNFSKLIALDSTDIAALFFRGISRLEQKNFNKAINDFERVSETQNEYYSDAAVWYLALVNIKLDNRELSVKLLKKLHGRKGQFQQRALELSDKL